MGLSFIFLHPPECRYVKSLHIITVARVSHQHAVEVTARHIFCCGALEEFTRKKKKKNEKNLKHAKPEMAKPAA